MAANVDSSVKDGRSSTTFISLLTSAACEWLLIFLLLIDAVFSYLLTVYARYCELQMPCVFCSRLDRILDGQKPDFYRKLLCRSHRSEMSSLLACQIHDNIADGRGMCDDCVLSMTMKSMPDPDMHRLLPSKTGFNIKSRDLTPSLGTKLCSCCNKPWRNRQHVQRLLQLRPPTDQSRKPPLPRRSSSNGSLKRMKIKVVAKPQKKAAYIYDHAGYTRLKIHSDADSELASSDDDALRDAHGVLDFRSAPEIPHRKPSGLPPRKMTAHYSNTMPSVTASKEDVKYPPEDEKACPSSLPELISLDDFPPAPSHTEVPVWDSSVTHNTNYPSLSELIDLVEARPSSDLADVLSKASPENANLNGSDDNTINNHGQVLPPYGAKAEADISNGAVIDPSVKASFGVQSDQSWTTEAANDASGTQRDPNWPTETAKDREASGWASEQPLNQANSNIKVTSGEDSPKVGASSRKPLNEASNNIRTNGGEDSQEAQASNISEVPNVGQSEIFDEYHYHGSYPAGSESYDGITVSEIEGESLLDRLRRQIEYDRRCLSTLQKELEEERSAAAIAANEAMAMITRLQEEKAALHMEASHYLRMMEEQAEHDVGALERANDLLAEKEKEIQDLEAELEYYTLNPPDEAGNATAAHPSMTLGYPVSSTKAKENYSPNKLSWLGFEDEKLYILERLWSLEKGLRQLVDNKADISDRGNSEESEKGRNKEDSHHERRSWKDCEKKENHPSTQIDTAVSNGANHPKVGSDTEDSDLGRIKNEIAELHERLEALETDRNFMEHLSNTLAIGSEGLVFIQDVAHQLDEIRKLGTGRSESAK